MAKCDFEHKLNTVDVVWLEFSATPPGIIERHSRVSFGEDQ